MLRRKEESIKAFRTGAAVKFNDSKFFAADMP